MNPCLCAPLGDERRTCRCTPAHIATYRGQLSGPLRDRIDLIVDVPAVPVQDITDTAPGEPTASVRDRVSAARGTAWAVSWRRGCTNADLRSALVGRICNPDANGRVLLRQPSSVSASARGYDRVLKVSRMIADLAGSEGVRSEHVAEAQYRLVE